LQGGQIHKIQLSTTRRATQLQQFVEGLRAGCFCLADRLRPAGCRLPTSGLQG